MRQGVVLGPVPGTTLQPLQPGLGVPPLRRLKTAGWMGSTKHGEYQACMCRIAFDCRPLSTGNGRREYVEHGMYGGVPSMHGSTKHAW